jgi:hypothetical protein
VILAAQFLPSRRRTSSLPVNSALLTAKDLRLVGPIAGVQLQFPADDVIVLDRVAAVGRQWFDEVNQDACALDVAQEPGRRAGVPADARWFLPRHSC